MEDALRNRQPTEPAPPQAGRRRPALTKTEQELVGMMEQLQRRTGSCWASLRYLAEQLGVSTRQVRRLLNGYKRSDRSYPGLVERGVVAAVMREGQTTLFRVIDSPCGELVENSANPGHRCPGSSPAVSGVVSAPGRTPVSANRYSSLDKRGAGSAPTHLFDRRPILFNVFRPLHQGDWMKPEDRICLAFTKYRAFLFMDHEGRQRAVVGMRHGQGRLCVSLAVEGEPERVELVYVPICEMTSRRFWR